MNFAPATGVILLVTTIATVMAFRRQDLRERWMFKPYEILRYRQYERMLSSGLIHADWMHFAFNAFSFYSFAESLELIYGAKTLLAVYLSSILGGSTLSLIVHRHHDYRALGASGGVCGVIFASIFLLPGGSIMVFPLPIGIPSWLYAVGFLLLSYFALRRQAGNIGHDAHLGGAMVGLLVATACYPSLVLAAPWLFSSIMVLSLAILLLLILDPLHLLKQRLKLTEVPKGNIRFQHYEANRERNRKMAEIDRLLDKISEEGLHSLSRLEREQLDQLSREVGRQR